MIMEVSQLWVRKDKTIQVESSTIRVMKIRDGEALVEVNSPAPIGVGVIFDEHEIESDVDDSEVSG